MTASSLVNQAYTITDQNKTYQVPVFISDPAWCAITYSYTISESSGDGAVTFNDDPTVREFTFNYYTDLDICGLTSIDYEITVIGSNGITVK